MFSLNSKLDPNLKTYFNNKLYKNYRVIIKCTSLQENIERKISASKGEIIRSIPSIKCICAYISQRSLERLIEYPEVEYVAFDDYAYICGKSAFHANRTKRQDNYKLTGKEIGIGIVDTGVFPHSDLTKPYNRIKHFEDILNGLKYPYDDNGHGTFISGIICGNGISSKGVYKGVAEESHIYMVKCFNNLGRAYISDTLWAIENIISNQKEFNIKILCLPFEVTTYNPFLISLYSRLFDIAIENGLTVVVPSGSNDSKECSIRGIASLSNCLTVGGLDTEKEIASYRYSSSGPYGKLDKPDLSAACVDICSLNSNANYISERNGMKIYAPNLQAPYTDYTGTSCAAAYVSGICSLLYQNNPQYTFKDIQALIKLSCSMHSISKWLQGAGTIDIGRLFSNVESRNNNSKRPKN